MWLRQVIQKLNELCDYASELDPNFVRASAFTQTLRDASKCYNQVEENKRAKKIQKSMFDYLPKNTQQLH